MVIFPVDDVAAAAEPLPTAPLSRMFPNAIAVGGDPDLAVVTLRTVVHPLLYAVGRAHAESRPLALSPDAVWLTIAEGLAQHVRLHAGHPSPPGKPTGRRLEIVPDGPAPRDADSWRHLIARQAGLPDARATGAALFACDFTTSTEVERVAALATPGDGYWPYFGVWTSGGRGLPAITLTGAEQDWRTIRERVEQLPRFGLAGWHRSLAPIADQFVRAASGDVDTAFWQHILDPADVDGAKTVTGWIARLFPYVAADGVPASRPNPLLELPLDAPHDGTDGNRPSRGPGVRIQDVQAVLSRVVVHVDDRTADARHTVALHGGLVAVAQDAAGALCPVAGWHLTSADAEMEDLLDRIEREHVVTAPGHAEGHDDADLEAMFQRMGSATLFGGRWRLARPDRPRRVILDGGITVTPVIDLPDGRSISWVHRLREQGCHWAVCRVEEVRTDVGRGLTVRNFEFADDPAEVWLYGTSFAALLEVALDSGGDIGSLRSGRLADLLHP
ncbi:hypothetical protein CS0771_56310 [Catellatospora sp. IY07-71]|uniref:DUF4419 domain-containing protein n=1 Tax=Catellatospora sp. IY07-71 TaxID=2728827 RepID=UPI001BB45B54|nr:DUF4419 domain-containing protein [Catellatospora sp. IY07-71]BCJ76087.1 hypothetical protein CS0771_56310 [Catellatospora sp. IY07-71]